MNKTLGLWGAYMPFGTAIALLCGPLVIALVGLARLVVVAGSLVLRQWQRGSPWHCPPTPKASPARREHAAWLARNACDGPCPHRGPGWWR